MNEPSRKAEPVAWMLNGIIHECDPSDWAKEQYPDQDVIPLYTHPVKELTDRIAEQEKFIKAILKKGGCDGNICQKYNANPVKELTDDEIVDIGTEFLAPKDCDIYTFARAILRKAQDK